MIRSAAANAPISEKVITQSAPAAGTAVSGATSSAAATGHAAFDVSVICVFGGRIGVGAVEDELRLWIELVMEIDGDVVVAGSQGERPDDQDYRQGAEEDRWRDLPEGRGVTLGNGHPPVRDRTITATLSSR